MGRIGFRRLPFAQTGFRRSYLFKDELSIYNKGSEISFSPAPVRRELMWSWLPGPLNFLLFFIGLFLILLVLIQRGKGGGLVGALGGIGGSSPFGSRAGDTFTRYTIYVACIWLFLTMVQVIAIQEASKKEAPASPLTTQR